MNDANRELVDRYLAAYNAFDVESMLQLMHDDVQFENISDGAVTASARGIAELRELATHASTVFASRRQTVRDFHSEGDRAVVEIDYEGVLAADLGPMKAGDTLRMQGRSTFVIRDGRIASLVDES